MVHEIILVGCPTWQRLLNNSVGLAKGDSLYIMYIYILQFQSCWKPAGFKCDDRKRQTADRRPERAHTGVHFG